MTANKTERKLTRSGNSQTLQGVVGDTDADDIEIFGYELIYTTGEFWVEREALIEKAEELGIADWMLPTETKPHYAFGRAIDDLLEGREEIMVPVQGAPVDEQRVRFVLDQNESRYSYTLDARVYFPPELTDSDDGTWNQVEMGVIKYDKDTGSVRFIDRVEDSHKLFPYWAAQTDDDPLTGGLKQRMEALFEQHCNGHTGKDVNNMTYYLVNQWTDAIRLRDACYFVPATHEYRVDGETRPIEDLIDAFSALYDWLNVQKSNPDSDVARSPTYSQQTHMDVVEIMDTDRQRDMVERKVEERMTNMAEEMAESVVDRLAEDETVVADVADEVIDALDNLKAIAGEYDDLLDGGRKEKLKTRNAVKRAMNGALADLESDKAELVEAVIEESDADVPLGKAEATA